jgi:hypothetical protein
MMLSLGMGPLGLIWLDVIKTDDVIDDWWSLLSFPEKKYGLMSLKLMFMSLLSLMMSYMSFQIDLPKNPALFDLGLTKKRLETGTADANGCCWCSSPWLRSQLVIIYQHDGSMVLVYSWCSMDPMNIPPWC